MPHPPFFEHLSYLDYFLLRTGKHNKSSFLCTQRGDAPSARDVKAIWFPNFAYPFVKGICRVHQCKRSLLIIALLLLVLACALQKLKAHQTSTSLALQNLTSELPSTFRMNVNCYPKLTTLDFSYPVPPVSQTPYRASYSWCLEGEQTKSQTDSLLHHSPV